MSDPSRPIRIAIRAEGDTINAYLAKTGTMEGAQVVASISRSFAVLPGVFDSFRATMEQALTQALKLHLGPDAVHSVETSQAAEHERAGHA